jgi:asparagine synthase (glutamine-hydrolysing)
MCGICGIVNFDNPRIDTSVIAEMREVMRHRGPDGEGLFAGANVAFGHVRLSIIDVAGSKQPLANEDDSVWVTFNGEIYNYQELREELQSKGHHLRTQGDTEVLVHLYEEYGSEMLGHLQGMFAFAIWDRNRRQLFLARDRMGIKPLYYCRCGGDFVFASEPKAFFQHPDIRPRLSTEGVWHYLAYRSSPAPGTLFEDIFKVKPGHFLMVTEAGLTPRRYWDIPLERNGAPGMATPQDPREIGEKVESLLRTSVKRRLISDVPVGAFLSGGVDSSLIVALMSMISNAPVRTYSVGFRNFPLSELPYAKIVADKYQTDHHELVLDGNRFVDYLEKLTWIRDSPLSEPADVPLYLLSRMAQQDVKVLLSGEGCDELFGGYPKYAYDRFSWAFNWLPGECSNRVANALPGRLRRAEIALRSLSERDPADRWALWFSPFTRQQRTMLMPSHRSWANPTQEHVDAANGASALDAMLYTDCKLWLPDNLLDRGDRMTMGASVEGRVPFLDHELVEYAFSLPKDVKIRGMVGKWVIKQIALKYLPEAVVLRRKIGFRLPLTEWFRGELRDMCYDRICSRRGLLSGLLDLQMLHNILDDHCAERKDNWIQIYALLALSIWSDVFSNGLGSRTHRHPEQTAWGTA